MPDPIAVAPPTDQTTPLDAGHTTSEYFITKIILALSAFVAVAGSVLDVVNTFVKMLPEGSWVFKALAVAGAVVAVVQSVVYTLSRTQVKLAALNNSAGTVSGEQAAAILDAAARK
jgi:hypothetical protein